MSISFSVRRYPKRRLVSEYQHCNFIRLSNISLNFTIHFNVKCPWESFIVKCRRNNGIMVLLKTLLSQRCNNIPLWALCFFIYFECVDTVIFKDRYLTNEYSYRADFTDLAAVYGSDDGLKRKFTYM